MCIRDRSYGEFVHKLYEGIDRERYPVDEETLSYLVDMAMLIIIRAVTLYYKNVVDREKLLEGLFFSLLNLGYAWYQDRYIFPEEFCDYRDYQNAVPFLIPGRGQKDGKRK